MRLSARWPVLSCAARDPRPERAALPSAPPTDLAFLSSQSTEGADRGAGLGLFLISVAALALQVLQTRVLAVQMWHHHSYMVVTMTLLGFAAAGSLATVWTRPWRRDPGRSLALLGCMFAITTLVGDRLLSLTADRAAELTAEGQYLVLSLFYSFLVVPYLVAGLIVAVALSAAAKVSRLYFFNLAGSAIGAWLFIGAIGPLGGERLLVACAALGPIAGLAFLRRPAEGGQRANWPGGVCLVTLAVCTVGFLAAPRLFPVGVASNKAMHDVLTQEAGAELLEQHWTPLCRLDVVKRADVPGGGRLGKDLVSPVNIYQDGDAITVMHSDDSWASYRDSQPLGLNQLVYAPHQVAAELAAARGEEVPVGPRSLVIGVGGGIDLRYGLDEGASSILGIELNAGTVDLVGNRFRDLNDDIYHREGVEVRVGEGRSTLRRLDETFDVIELSGTDTYTAGTAGAYVLSESYLYTEEAMGDYFERLSPDRGTLGVIRLAYDPPRESLRLFAIALTQLRDRFGVEQPSRHAAVILEEVDHERENLVVRFTGSVFSRQPLSPETIARYQLAGSYDTWSVHYLPGVTSADSPFAQLAQAIDEGTEEQFYANYPFEVAPVADDSPFFFHFHGWSDLFQFGGADEWEELTGGPIGLEILATLLAQTSLLVILLVLAPLLLLKGGGERPKGILRHLIYFLALGAGFMFLEISTMQRLVLYLGAPTYSLTVTLFCFLLFAGLGSLFAGRFEDNPTASLKRILPILCVAIALLIIFQQPLLDATLELGLTSRILIVAATLAPVNFLMGMPFPLGLARLRSEAPRFVPWALGANGGASVVASILCVVVAMEAGFSAVGLLALATYALGGAASLIGVRSESVAG